MKKRLFVLLTCVYLAIAGREPPWGDAHVVYATTQNLVDHGHIDVDLGGPPQFYAIRNGKKYGVFPLGNVLAMAPSYLVFHALAAIPRAPVDFLFRLTTHLSPALLVAGACVLLFVLGRREGATERASAWLALGLGTTTILAVYARSPYSEALQTLVFTWVIERGLALGERLTRSGALLGGVACGLLVNTKLIYALAVPVVALYVVWRHRGEIVKVLVSLALAAIPLSAFAVFALWHNHLKTGTLFDSGYAIPDGVFSGDAYAALDGFFFSTGKSIFLYSPLLVLSACALPSWLRRDRARAIFVLATCGVVTLANAKFRYWHADYCWGPRLLVPMTPAFFLPIAHWIEPALSRGRARLRALLVGALVGAGIFVQVLGCSLYWDHWIRIAIAVKDQTGAGSWYTEDLHHCHFIPQFSPLVGHAWLLGHLARGDDDLLIDAPWRRVIAGKVNVATEWRAVRLDSWVAELIQTKSLWPLGGGIVLSLGGVSAWSVVGIRRRLRASPETIA